MAAEETVENPEFMHLPLDSIIVEEQIRSRINAEGESFRALIESIKERGVIEPVIVTPRNDKYLLVCGERRYQASLILGMELIPVRILDAATQKDEMLAYQLTENLQREDLNYIDQVKGILAYIQAKHPDKNYDVQGVMSELIRYKLKPDDLSDEMVPTVGTISEITGKSITTLFNMISLLKLSDEIQAAIQQGNLPVSQGYLFAANLECPALMKIFQDITKTPVTNAALERMLTEYKKVKRDLSGMKPVPLTKQHAALKSIKTVIKKSAGKYAKEDLEKLLEELETICTMVKEQVQAVSPEAQVQTSPTEDAPANPPQV